MILTAADFRDLRRPFRSWAELRAFVMAHTVWHLLGGAGLYVAFRLLGFPHPVGCVLLATAARQEVCREVKGATEFPLYAMLWDTVASVAASALLAAVWHVA